MHNLAAHSIATPTPYSNPVVGFYRPDPGGKPANIVLSRAAAEITVYQPANEMILTLDPADWMDVTALKTRFTDVSTDPRYSTVGPMADMRDRLLAGYVSSMAEAVEIANNIEEHVARALTLLDAEAESAAAPR